MRYTIQPALLIVFFVCFAQKNIAQEKTDPWLEQLITKNASPFLRNVLNFPDSFQYQIIYTQINRDRFNQPHFKNHFLHVNRNRYFNPASTVKLPTVLIALEKLNQLSAKGIDLFTPMLTDSSYKGQSAVIEDSTAENGLPSIAHYIKKIFLTSDNDAYNRLYEFAGQQTLNETLWEKGYRDIRIVRRFVPMNEEQNRHTNAIRFIKNNRLIYLQPPADDTLAFDYSKIIRIGKGHYDQDEKLIMEPMDFTKHNNLPLEDLQSILQSVLFPASVPLQQRFHLTDEMYKFLYRYMSQYPSETLFPHYDTTEYFDSYTKFIYKSNKSKIPDHIRIFNKPGWSYGFLTDAAYVADFKNNTEFMLSAVIYVNSDGILNDDQYDYETIGYPFFKEIGAIISEYELKRKRKHIPDLSEYKISYDIAK